jgi:hypothetical protein
MNSRLLIMMPLIILLLAACSAPATASVSTSTPEPEATLPSFESLARLDEQGAVIVSVEPTNLDNPGETYDFQIGMNTHSVELDMDLTQLASLTTDTGETLQPSGWEGGRGGHHVTGVLSFPADAEPTLLEGASTLTLTIRDVDVPERVFTWQLEQ